jgi:hypothetical protein
MSESLPTSHVSEITGALRANDAIVRRGIASFGSQKGNETGHLGARG